MVLLLAFIVICVVFLISLGKEKSVKIQWNQKEAYDINEHIFYLDTSDDANIDKQFKVLDKNTGESEPLVIDLGLEEYEVLPLLYQYNNKVYYIARVFDKSKRGKDSSGYRTLQIREIDTDTYDNKVIYEQIYYEKEILLGAQTSNSSDQINSFEISDFFLDNDSIYLITADEIWQMDRKTEIKEMIITYENKGNIAFDGENIYYTNERMQIVKYNVKTKKSMTFEDAVTQYFLVDQNNIYFINKRDDNTLYMMDMTNGEMIQYLDASMNYFGIKKSDIYFIDNTDRYLHQYDFAKQQDIVLLEEPVVYVEVMENYDYLYVLNNEGTICWVKERFNLA